MSSAVLPLSYAARRWERGSGGEGLTRYCLTIRPSIAALNGCGSTFT